jgi:hypothetical protein
MKRSALGLLIIVTSKALHALVTRYALASAGEATPAVKPRELAADYDDMPCTD